MLILIGGNIFFFTTLDSIMFWKNEDISHINLTQSYLSLLTFTFIHMNLMWSDLHFNWCVNLNWVNKTSCIKHVSFMLKYYIILYYLFIFIIFLAPYDFLTAVLTLCKTKKSLGFSWTEKFSPFPNKMFRKSCVWTILM